jgi:hypothetical protein
LFFLHILSDYQALNNSGRTFFKTLATPRAFITVNDRQEFINYYSLFRACFFTFPTAETANIAYCLNDFSAVMGTAKSCNFLRFFYQPGNMARTDIYTCAFPAQTVEDAAMPAAAIALLLWRQARPRLMPVWPVEMMWQRRLPLFSEYLPTRPKGI